MVRTSFGKDNEIILCAMNITVIFALWKVKTCYVDVKNELWNRY
jgi:hypothetical protein